MQSIGGCRVMSRQIKDMLIEDIQSRIGEHRDMLVVDCSGLDAVSANKWRISLRESNISVLSVKNSIAKNALERIGVGGLDSVLAGPSALVWGGDDVVALSKEIAKWAKELLAPASLRLSFQSVRCAPDSYSKHQLLLHRAPRLQLYHP